MDSPNVTVEKVDDFIDLYGKLLESDSFKSVYFSDAVWDTKKAFRLLWNGDGKKIEGAKIGDFAITQLRRLDNRSGVVMSEGKPIGWYHIPDGLTDGDNEMFIFPLSEEDIARIAFQAQSKAT
ncbi:MAG TPA: hypothetical protein VMQ44_03915 [Candidatus Saccharimonadales bacterium]|nr:hypothetical protein [Candidatus Saccharimonadales bacterium]